MEQFFPSDVHFHVNLRTKKKGQPTLLYFIISHKSKQYKIPTKVKVYPEHFDGKRVIINKTMPTHIAFNNEAANRKLLELESTFFRLIDYLCREKDVDIQKGINVIYYNGKPLRVKKGTMGKKIRPILYKAVTERKLADGTKQNYLLEINGLCDYANSINKEDVSYLNFDLIKGYYDKICAQTVTHKITGEKVYIEDNVAIAKIRKLQSVLNFVEESDKKIFDKYIKGISLSSIYNKVTKDKVEENQVFISDEEVDKLMTIDDVLTKKEIVTRDIFVFQLEIGQRVSDVLKMLGKPLDINNDSLTIIQQKTKAKVTVPFTERVKQIVTKYNNVLPEISVSTYDRYIKNVCEKAGLNEPIQCSEHRNHELYTYIAPKYKLVASHSARRSFISNGLKVIDSKVLSKISGHTTEASFNKYNRLSSKDAVDIYLKKKQGATEENRGPITTVIPSSDVDITRLPMELKARVYRQQLNSIMEGADSGYSDEEIIAMFEGGDYKKHNDVLK